MTDAAKRRAIIFLILTALITVLLAVALPQLQLQQGVPLPAANSPKEGAPQAGTEPPLSINLNTFLETVIGLFILMVTIYIIVKRRQGVSWKAMIQPILAFAVFSLVLTFLLYAFSNIKINLVPAAIEVLPAEMPMAPQAGPPLAPLPASLLWLVWIILAGIVLVPVFLMARARATQRRAGRDPLALEAEQAVEAIKAGQDLSNVIIRCYEQMSVVLKKEQGLTLEDAMTAREFEALLEKRGVPNPPVRQLTRLFEIARYAAQAPGPAEEAQALACLDEIARSSLKKERGQPR